VKLTSTARLRIVTVAIATVLTASIGSFIANQSYKSEISSIDQAINETVIDATKSPNQELSAALFHIDEFSLDFSLLLVSRDGSVTTVNQSTKQLFNEISLKKVIQAQDHVYASHDSSDYRFRSLEISGGDYLVVAASSTGATSDLKANLVTVAFTTALTTLFAFILFSLYIRRLKRRDDEDALQRMQAFLGDASHELRTPLTVIKGYVEMLSKGQMSAPADQERAFSRVNTEIGRMETLIHDLLLLAELGESAAREAEVLDLSALGKGLIEDFATLHPERSVEVRIESGCEVIVVKEYLVRFIQNSLNNISRHTASGAPVRFSLTHTAKTVTLIIEDGGEGLPDSAYGEKILSLTRFDKSRSRESGGSGLGLSIMAAVIAKLDGSLTLRKSDLGGLAVVAELAQHRE
jgi:two-component system OmpR family sensor kinase